MVVRNVASVGEKARLIYEEKLRVALEKKHLNQFVAIEPESGEYFLGQTLTDAIAASRAKYPNRLTHVIRVGDQAALRLGMPFQ